MWIRASRSKDKMTSIFNVASCALRLQTIPVKGLVHTNDIDRHKQKISFTFTSLCSCCNVANMSLYLHVHTKNITSFLRRDNGPFHVVPDNVVMSLVWTRLYSKCLCLNLLRVNQLACWLATGIRPMQCTRRTELKNDCACH